MKNIQMMNTMVKILTMEVKMKQDVTEVMIKMKSTNIKWTASSDFFRIF